jgi:hypothetical protein
VWSTVITAICPVRPTRRSGGRDLRLLIRVRPAEGALTPVSGKGRDGPMASIAKRIKDFARSPRGQQLIEQAKEQASKPENRRRLQELRSRYVKRR